MSASFSCWMPIALAPAEYRWNSDVDVPATCDSLVISPAARTVCTVMAAIAVMAPPAKVPKAFPARAAFFCTLLRHFSDWRSALVMPSTKLPVLATKSKVRVPSDFDAIMSSAP